MKLRKIVVAGIAFVLPFMVLCFALFHLYEDQQEHKKGRDAYEKINQDYVEDQKDTEDETQPGESVEEEHLLSIDWDGLLMQYPDVIGWIDLPGTGISYPLVQGMDNSYYLSHLPTKEYAISGSVFMDYHNAPDFTSQNTILYGHNMKDGTMFANLDAYQDQAFYQEHPYFYIYVPNGTVLVYQIVSAYTGYTNGIAYTYDFPSESDFPVFLEKIRSNADYEMTNINMTSKRIVTLSTCTSTSKNTRYLVHGALVEQKVAN
ncbi:MAG: class B sortase [Hespellia sp.]|nr:class B sortase [Hespellia sp.]